MLLGVVPCAASAQTATMWDLSDLYATPAAWSASYARTQLAAKALGHYRGTLGSSADTLFTALDAMSTVNKETARLATYATLKGDEDLRSAADQERRQQAQSLATLVAEQTSWVAPKSSPWAARKSGRMCRPERICRPASASSSTIRCARHRIPSRGSRAGACGCGQCSRPTQRHP
ncbi:MAG: hypothetical protein WDM77_13570 [Steroidobacteraceae bacterium]